MNITPANIIANANNAHAQASEGQRRSGGRISRRDSIVQERIQERRREMQLRAREDKQIRDLQERMQKIKSSDMDFDLRMSKVSSLVDRINQIHENRAERESIAVEREMHRQKALIDENSRVREEQAEQDTIHKDREEAEEERERSAILSLTQIAVNQNNISVLRQTRAALAEEAGHVRRAIENDNSNYVKVGSEGIFSVQSGYSDPHDFRNRHLSKLNLGIARTDAAINSAVISMYRESAKLQESQLTQYRQQPEEDDGDDDENTGFNIEL
ncbi:MAG: hypothetical protein FWE20_04535 [Defluviitaleaceae bacterium]|nr:hypothetical protein [Defluviitaleaceae bacterium]